MSDMDRIGRLEALAKDIHTDKMNIHYAKENLRGKRANLKKFQAELAVAIGLTPWHARIILPGWAWIIAIIVLTVGGFTLGCVLRSPWLASGLPIGGALWGMYFFSHADGNVDHWFTPLGTRVRY